MRYFNVKQHREPRSMFYGDRLANIPELELLGTELTEEQAKNMNIKINLKNPWD